MRRSGPYTEKKSRRNEYRPRPFRVLDGNKGIWPRWVMLVSNDLNWQFRPNMLRLLENIRLTLLAAAPRRSLDCSAEHVAQPRGAALGESHVQDVRVVCDQYGRCYDARRTYRSTSQLSAGYYDNRADYSDLATGITADRVWACRPDGFGCGDATTLCS